MSHRITSISLNDLRCFAGSQSAKLSKITLLVGENSVGKSTLLGCINALARLASLTDLTDTINYFDQAPFHMGPFHTLVRSGSPSFRVGVELDNDTLRRLEIEFVSGPQGIPLEQTLRIELANKPPHDGAVLTIVRDTPKQRWRFSGPGFVLDIDHSAVSDRQFTTWLSRSVRNNLLPFGGDITQFRKIVKPITDRELAMFVRFTNFFRHQFSTPSTPLSIRPIDPNGILRERVYQHDPMNLDAERSHRAKVAALGSKLGLFHSIDIHQVAATQYEVSADISGTIRNLMDVGYGVTSVLSLVKSLAETSKDTLFLLQQPEIHIHPAAQAKLVEIVAQSNHTFVIETHSDHVIDWFRILVTEGILAASDVGIVYLERMADDRSTTRLHQLYLDANGNLSGQPRNYREFFSEETSRLLGWST